MLQVKVQHCASNCRDYLAKLTVIYSMILVQQVQWHYYCCSTLLFYIDQQSKNGDDAKPQVILGKLVGCSIYEEHIFW